MKGGIGWKGAVGCVKGGIGSKGGGLVGRGGGCNKFKLAVADPEGGARPPPSKKIIKN